MIPYANSDACIPKRLRKQWHPIHFTDEMPEESFCRLLNEIFRCYMEIIESTRIAGEKRARNFLKGKGWVKIGAKHDVAPRGTFEEYLDHYWPQGKTHASGASYVVPVLEHLEIVEVDHRIPSKIKLKQKLVINRKFTRGIINRRLHRTLGGNAFLVSTPISCFLNKNACARLKLKHHEATTPRRTKKV